MSVTTLQKQSLDCNVREKSLVLRSKDFFLFEIAWYRNVVKAKSQRGKREVGSNGENDFEFLISLLSPVPALEY